MEVGWSVVLEAMDINQGQWFLKQWKLVKFFFEAIEVGQGQWFLKHSQWKLVKVSSS